MQKTKFLLLVQLLKSCTYRRNWVKICNTPKEIPNPEKKLLAPWQPYWPGNHHATWGLNEQVLPQRRGLDRTGPSGVVSLIHPLHFLPSVPGSVILILTSVPILTRQNSTPLSRKSDSQCVHERSLLIFPGRK